MLFALPQALYIFGGAAFLAFGALLIAGPLAFRIRGIKTKGKIVAVKAVGGHLPVAEATQADVSAGDDTPLGQYFLKHPGVFLFVAIFFTTFVIFPIGFIGVGSYLAFSHAWLIVDGVKSSAEVSHIVHQGEGEQDIRRAFLSFNNASNEVQQFDQIIGIGGLPDVREGDEIVIYYWPDKPDGVVTGDFLHYMKLPSILIAIGLVFLMVISLFIGRGKNGQNAAFNGEIYYPVFEYVTPAGQFIRSTSCAGSATLGDKMPGSAVTLWVDPRSHTKAMRQTPLPYFLGLIFALPGLALVYFACTQFPFSWLAPVIVLAMMSMIGIGVYAVFRSQTSEGGLKKAARRNHEAEMAQGRVLSPAEFRARHQRRAEAMRPWLPLMAIVGVVAISGSLSLGQALATLEFEGLRADGLVVEVVREYQHLDDEYVYYPRVNFRHGEQEIQFRDSTGSNVSAFHVGQRVGVLYPPDQPAKAIIDRGWLNWSTAAAFLLFGLAMLWMTYRSFAGMRTRL